MEGGFTRQVGDLERFDEVLCLVVPDVDIAIVERSQNPGLARMEVNRLDSVRARRELALWEESRATKSPKKDE
jgi:hypothetical protein